ncbi:DUF947-domain-containing protein [Trichodelitschia bisporula]|uniref:rRNA biogenesis protein RRP36 n=1 Tax=Trichodelitschia bisporula TaxID=703511 RepID=A0A6G1HQC2_9PEZI|nr:DUF947-domain-containing protein [Trichodelitschia bisporula]
MAPDPDSASDPEEVFHSAASEAPSSASVSVSDSDSDSDAASSSSTPSNNDTTVRRRLAHVSFGALAAAQDTLSPKKRTRPAPRTADSERKLDGLRDRLREIREARAAAKEAKEAQRTAQATKATKRKAKKAHSDAGSDSDLDEDDGEDEDAPRKRAKHAPTSLPSNRPVTRKRLAVTLPASKTRDPRFDPIPGQPPPVAVVDDPRYAFLAEYEQSELKELRAKLAADKKARGNQVRLTAEEREEIQRSVVRLESRVATAKARAREKEVLKKVKREEREAVAQGKKPFFLKKSEVRKKVLVEKFEGMKGSERTKAVERRRKKVAQRERKAMPDFRRG